MKHATFVGAAIGWAAAMIGLAATGPTGAHPLKAALLYVAGFIGMIVMVRRFPASWSRRHTLVFVFTLAVAARPTAVALMAARCCVRAYASF